MAIPIEETVEKKKYTVEEFRAAYDKLSAEMGYELSVAPSLFQQDNGTFSFKVSAQFVPKENKE